MRKDIKEWWNTYIPHIRTTPWEFMQRMGDGLFRVESYVKDDWAEEIKTFVGSSLLYDSDGDAAAERAQYWKERGIERTVYGDPEELTSRTVYCPADVQRSEEKRPLIVCVYNAGVPMVSLEALGFVQIAARYGFIVLVPKDGNSDEHVLEAIDKTAEDYPVDRERIFIAGHSFGGASAGWQALRHPDVYAGACVLGIQCGGTDNTGAELAKAAELRLPMINICGTREVNRVLPLNRDTPDFELPPQVAPNLTPLPHTREICLKGVHTWRRINGTKEYSFEEDCAESLRVPEKIIGLRADAVETRIYRGREHYICDMLGAEGLPIVRSVAVKDCPHTVSPTAADLAWEFFRDIRRDKETKKIRYDVPASVWNRITATVEYDKIGPKYTGFRLYMKDGAPVLPVTAEDFTISGFDDMTQNRYQFHVLKAELQNGSELSLTVSGVSADPNVPVWGGRSFRGIMRVRCLVPGYEFTAADIAETKLPQVERYSHGSYTGSTGITIPYCYYKAGIPEGANTAPAGASAAADEILSGTADRTPEQSSGLPLIVYATGCFGENNADDNEQILGPGPLRMASEEFQAVFPCHVMAPWYPLGGHPAQGEEGQQQLEDYSRNLTELVEHTIKELGADPDRIYFIGNGGGAIYQSLSLGEHIYAAAAMLTTIFNFFDDGSEMKYLDNLAGMPIYITHATSDFACPVGRSRLSHARLRELGNKNLFYLERSDPELARFGIDTENEVGTHNSALLDYAGDEMFRWLFSFRKERN